MRRAFFFIVVFLFATTSLASIPRASMLDAAPPTAETLSETRIRVSEVLAPFERPQASELTRALRQGYEQASTTNASGLGRFLSVDPVLNVKRALREPQNWNRYAYAMNNPLKYTDPTGKDVSIGINFRGDGWTDEQKKQILAQVTQWYQKQNVGKVYIFDAAKQSHGRFLGNLLRGHTSISVTSGTGTGAHKPGMVYAGNYFNDKNLSAAQAVRATSNTIIHETAAHKFGATYLNGQDQLFYLRNIAIAQQDSALRARYGTVADSYAFDASDTRGNVTNGPIPIHPGDLRSLQQYLGPIHAEPPEDD